MTAQWPKRGDAPWDTALRAYIDEGDTPRTGTAAQWTAANTVLASGEQGYETDTGRLKVGDGATAWADLDYYDEHVAGAVVASGAVTAAIADEQTVIDAAAAAVGTAQLVTTTVTDAVGEWWIHPVATYQDRPYPRTVFGAISKTGKILACEFNHGAGSTRRYEVASAPVDDHNVPALWVENGRRPVIFWTIHGGETHFHVRVGSPSGDLRSLTDATAQRVTLPGTVSYTQAHKIEHLSDDAQDTFWVFTRVLVGESVGWYLQPLTVDQATGALTMGTAIQMANTPSGYFTTADAHATGNQVIRIAWGHNPSVTLNEVFYVELDCVTGEITSPLNAAFSANLDGTNLPLMRATTPMALPQLNTATHSRRMFSVRPGPDAPAIAHADWLKATPDAAVYTVSTIQDGITTLQPGTGAVTAAYDAALDDPNGFDYRVALRLPATTPANIIEIGARATGTYPTTSGWSLQISTGKVIGSLVHMSEGLSNHFIAAPPANWGDDLGVRLTVGGGKIRRYYSLNPLDASPTWVELGSGAGINVTGTVAPTTQPLVLTNRAAPPYTTVPLMYYASLRNSTGAVVAAVDFRTDWTPGATTHTDAAGRAWSVAGDATVSGGAITVVPTTFGIAGPRVGYTEGPNYIAGIAFENPSHDGAVLRARSADGTETVDRIVGTQTETLMTQPTTDGRLIRPYPPVNGGPFRALVTDMQHYGESGYTDYEGDVRGLS